MGGAEAPNHPPIAQDSCITVTNKQATVIDLSTLVTDPDVDDELNFNLGSFTVSGSVFLNNTETGSSIYSPGDSTFVGTDFFTYVVCDDGSPFLCDTAYIKLNVVDSIPEMMVVDTVIANNDTISVQKGESVDIFVTQNDFPPDEGEVTIIAPPGFGELLDLMGNLYNYTPFPNFTGEDFFTYSLCVQGTCDTAIVFLNVAGCDFMDTESLVIKKGISPNGDQINDFFEIPGLEDCFIDLNPTMMIYNRWGNLVYERTGYTGNPDTGPVWRGNWDSDLGGTDKDVPDGTYYWILKLDNGMSRAGYVEVLR